MKKLFWALTTALVVLGVACDRGQQTAVLPVPEATPPESPTARPSFQLEGTVIEASGSAAAGQASPSPTRRATGSPSPTETAAETPGAGTAIEQAAPGSIAIRLSSYSAPDTTCTFQEGDTVVVGYTRQTTFEPADITGNTRFPNNLANMTVSVAGEILHPENCVLSATSVTTQAQASPTATRGTTTTRTTPRTSPTPRRTASPSPAATIRATPTATATPSPTATAEVEE
ncbi:MAG: hypothetical protein M3198_11415 [Actinomycetota bacterium]|nr:hypothetical protein [Actinomycetota bacterium]